MEINSLRNFRKSISELKATASNREEEDFIRYYDKHMPLSDNPCIVNKIAHKVENVFDGDLISGKCDNFDYSIYMNCRPSEVIINANTRKKIIDIYNSYNKINKSKNSSISDEINREESNNSKNEKYEILKQEIKLLVTNELELCDILVELAYKKNVISKSFVWSMVGDIILNNLLKRNNNIITYPTRDLNGDIVYGGVRFSLKNKKVGVVI